MPLNREQHIRTLRRVLRKSTSAVERAEAQKSLTRLLLTENASAEPKSESEAVQPVAGVVPGDYGFGVFELTVADDDPHLMSIAMQHRDGLDSFCQWIEWRQCGQHGGWWDAEREHCYQTARQAEMAYWREFRTPTADFSSEWITKSLQYIWTFPIRFGRQWSAATLDLAVRELGLDISKGAA